MKFALIWPREWADKCVAAGNLEALATEWAEGLSGMSPEAMRRAVEHCRAQLKWSPSIAEFREAGKAGMTSEQRAFAARLAESEADARALPSKTWAERRAEGVEHLRGLKDLLGA